MCSVVILVILVGVLKMGEFFIGLGLGGSMFFGMFVLLGIFGVSVGRGSSGVDGFFFLVKSELDE